MSDLLALALEAHGGLDRWRELSEVRARVRSGGLALRMKGVEPLIADFEVRVSTRSVQVVLAPYPEAGRRGVFEAAGVRVETDDGAPVASLADPRRLFPGVRRRLRWDALDLLYFAGYALRNYLTTPYLLASPGVEVRELAPAARGGERLRRLHARFPASYPTHSRDQVFWFGEDGLLRRHDYTADVFGRWATAAQLCTDPVEADGVRFLTRRRVVPRAPGRRALPGPTLVHIAFDELAAS